MKITDLLKIDNIVSLNNIKPDAVIDDFFVCDLLSWVTGHVKKDNTALITINCSFNVIAVATLLNIPCIIFCDDVTPKIELINKANEEGITLFAYPYSSFSLVRKINNYEI